MNRCVTKGLSIAFVLTGSTLALAQEAPSDATAGPPAPGGAQPAEAATAAPPAPAPAGAAAPDTVADGARFRFGVSGGVGFFSVKPEVGEGKVNCTYFGTDVRLGVQINNLIGVYAQPTLGYYTASAGGLVAAGGLLGFSAAADVTFIDRFFVGAGIGYTVYNNPGGVTPILRVGGYPLMARSDTKARRKGLMLGMDLRFTGLDGLKEIIMPTFNVGYEAF